MCEITNKNFEEKYQEVIDSLRSAAFISIDCEFSGINDSSFRTSWFDTPKELFLKKQKCLLSYRIIEFGLSMFEFDRKSNNFNVTTYSFYLLPLMNIKKFSKFSWQLESVNFLCTFNFDFNKVFYDGISYLSKMDEAVILDMINNETICEILNEFDVQSHYSKILQWASKASEGEEMLIELEGKLVILKHILELEIRKNISNVWTSVGEKNVIKIKKISKSEKLVLSCDKKDEAVLKKKIFDTILGFSKIIHEIERLQKPIIGHNLFADLIIIYQQFYNRTPLSYSNFKQEILKIFPCVYDTKLLSVMLRMKIPREDLWNYNSLPDLYSYFKNGTGSKLILFSPFVIPKEENYLSLDNFHDAGFDSYCTGFCFVKMSYMYLLWNENLGKFSQTTVSKTITSLLSAVKHLSNKVYLTRSDSKWIDLNGPDPKKVQPQLIYIQARGNKKLNLIQISDKIAGYNSVEFKLLNGYSGLLAISHKQHTKEIRSYFEGRDEFIVSDYSFLKHSVWGKMIIRGFFVSAVLGVIITSNVLRLSKFVRLT